MEQNQSNKSKRLAIMKKGGVFVLFFIPVFLLSYILPNYFSKNTNPYFDFYNGNVFYFRFFNETASSYLFDDSLSVSCQLMNTSQNNKTPTLERFTILENQSRETIFCCVAEKNFIGFTASITKNNEEWLESYETNIQPYRVYTITYKGESNSVSLGYDYPSCFWSDFSITSENFYEGFLKDYSKDGSGLFNGPSCYPNLKYSFADTLIDQKLSQISAYYLDKAATAEDIWNGIKTDFQKEISQ